MHAALSIAKKDLTLLLRDRSGAIFTMIFPLVFALFFGVIFSSGDDDDRQRTPLAIIDLDRSAASAHLNTILTRDDRLTLSYPQAQDAAITQVRSGDLTAAVIIPQGFDAALNNIITGDQLALTLITDPSKPAEAGYLQGALMSAAFEVFGSAVSDTDRVNNQLDTLESTLENSALNPIQRIGASQFLKGLSTLLNEAEPDEPLPSDTTSGDTGGGTSGAWSPVNLTITSVTDLTPPEDQPKRKTVSGFAVTFAQAMAWAMMGCTAAFAVSIVLELTGGTILRIQASPIRPSAYLLGKALACLTATTTICAALFAIAYLAFGVRAQYPLELALAILCGSLAFAGLMMLLAVVGRSKESPGQVAWGALLLMALIGGGMIPSFLMPSWLATLSVASPIHWAIKAIDTAIWRGDSPTDILTPCAILLAIAAFGFLAGTTLYKASPTHH